MKQNINPIDTQNSRPYIAVASSDNLLVDLHLGQSRSLSIFKQTNKGFKYVEKRKTPETGIGDFRWIRLAQLLNDCRAIVVNDAGYNPVNILHSSGIQVIKMRGLIDEGLSIVCQQHNPAC